ncbi:hypothetical protein, conserved, partial [Eimeria maxima]
MGSPWHGARPSLLEDVNPQHGRAEAAERGLHNGAKNKGYARKRGASASRKSNSRHIRAATMLAATFMVLLLLDARYSVSSRLRSYLETPQLPTGDESVQKYMSDFTEAMEAMNEAWESSEKPVREAFERHFTPSLDDGQELTGNPLAIINNHVAMMRECEFPFDSSVNAQKDFLQHLQLLRSICRTVTLRLEELKWFVYMNKECDVPVPVPGHDGPYTYTSLEVLEERVDDGLQAEHFLQSAGFVRRRETQKVDKNLTEKLIYLLSIENKHNVCNLVARYYFEHFLQPSGEDNAFNSTPPTTKHQIPYSGEAFRTGSFARRRRVYKRESEINTNYATIRKMHRIADNWTTKGVLEAANEQEEENAYNFERRLLNKREQMRVLLKEGIPYDDL